MSADNRERRQVAGCWCVTADEVDQWVAAIRRLYPGADLAGGIAPRTLIERDISDRDIGTMHEHLRADERVSESRGVVGGGKYGGPRLSYVPTGVDS